MRKSVKKMVAVILLAMGMLVGCAADGETNVLNDHEDNCDTSGVLSTVEENQNGSEKNKPEENKPEENKPKGNESEGNGSPYLIRVDRNANCVTIYERDSDGAYKVPVKYMVCSVGTGENTPTGVFTISDQYRWRALFGGTYGQYASRITGNILFHSVPYLEKSEDSLMPGAYNQLGTKASQGCVRLTCSDAKWIYDYCPPGTVVEIFDGPTTNVPEKPAALHIDPESPYSGWDPTDPSPNNPWRTVSISINRVEDLMVAQGSDVDLLANVFALDVDGKSLLEVRVSGTVDMNRCGTYIVAYSAVGVTGATVTVYATVTVVERMLG